MATASDFRSHAFDPARVDAAGRNIGGRVYWRLYSIENLVRVVVHSVLTAQAGVNWWNVAVDSRVRQRVVDNKRDYSGQPWHGTPGTHDIYYTLLSDLSRMIAANSHLFQPVIPDVNQWVARLEQVRLPRNIVGHMNWPSSTDRQRIEVCHADLRQLVAHLDSQGLVLSIP